MTHGFDPARLDRIPAFLAAKYVDTGRLPHGHESTHHPPQAGVAELREMR